MNLKAPGIVVFMLSVILAVTVLIVRYFGSSVPMLTSDSYQFYGLLLSYGLLLLGNLGRGL